ncbi:DUF6496 domain-containing protein [Methylobacter sp.]|uniref:DUF6496 domain-containing protein n=1 Tax=Methylobacter sp. TaxID=2051955 RepID=UPI003DA3E3C5
MAMHKKKKVPMLKKHKGMEVEVEVEMEHKSKPKKKFSRVMKEFKEGKLHSGSKKGPKVKNPKQAVAIAYSEERRKASKDESHPKKVKRKRK